MIISLFAISCSIEAINLKSKTFFSNSGNFATGKYNDINLLVTIELAEKLTDFIPDKFTLNLYSIKNKKFQKLKLNYSHIPKGLGEYPYLGAIFIDFNRDGQDELVLVRSQGAELGDIFVYKRR